MSKSISNLIDEYINYQYSREHYDLLKECHKIDLMEEYINNQLYSRKNSTINDYYMEYVDNDILSNIITEAEESKINIWDKLRIGFTKVIDYFRKIIYNVMNKNEESMKLANAILNKLNNATIDEESSKHIAELCTKSLNDANGFDPKANQPFSQQLKFSLPGVNESQIKDLLSCALSNGLIKVNTIKLKDKNYGSISPDILIDALFEFLQNDDASLSSFTTRLSNAFISTQKEGLTIEINPRKIKNSIHKLTQIQNSLSKINNKKSLKEYYDFTEDYFNELSDEWKKAADKVNANQQKRVADKKAQYEKQKQQKNATKNPSEANTAYTIFKEIIGVTIQIYSGFIKYRNEVLLGLKDILQKETNNKKE